MLPENSTAAPQAFSQLRTWMEKQIASAKAAAIFPPAPTRANHPSSAWYAGMVIDPSDFGQQLCRLQVSLQGAGTPMAKAMQVVEKT